jgi:dihydroorotate dehydrogenase electron transfer subunit
LQRTSSETQVMILENRLLNGQTAILTLDAPFIARDAQPGQFVNLSCEHFLRRPIGIMQRDRSIGTIQVGIRIQGAGTAWLAGLKPGAQISCLGPLGHGFDLAGLRRVITVGGGTGVFPLYFVQQVCREKGVEGMAVCGYRSEKESILVQDYLDLACQCLFASESGGLDVEGHAVKALEKLMQSDFPHAGTAILTCGPNVMMKAVAEIAHKYGLPCQVSLEERMACGIGVCLVCACAVKASQDGQDRTYQRCCADGPVFPAEVVEWPT